MNKILRSSETLGHEAQLTGGVLAQPTPGYVHQDLAPSQPLSSPPRYPYRLRGLWETSE